MHQFSVQDTKTELTHKCSRKMFPAFYHFYATLYVCPEGVKPWSCSVLCGTKQADTQTSRESKRDRILWIMRSIGHIITYHGMSINLMI